MSTIQPVPTSYFVYSSLSAFGELTGGELPGMWFMRALQDAGRDPAAIRQTLYRMETEGELTARKAGRAKFYSATPYALAEIAAGRARILEPAADTWDGRWTIVHLGFRPGEGQRIARERIVALLAVHGFALLGGDTYASPRDVAAALTAALPPAAHPHVAILVGPLAGGSAATALTARWNVEALAKRYRATLARLQRVEPAVAEGLTDRDAFLLRFAVVLDYLQVAWDDPDLPRALLPDDWPGVAARAMAASLYRSLLPGATRRALTLLESPSSARSRATKRSHS